MNDFKQQYKLITNPPNLEGKTSIELYLIDDNIDTWLATVYDDRSGKFSEQHKFIKAEIKIVEMLCEHFELIFDNID